MYIHVHVLNEGMHSQNSHMNTFKTDAQKHKQTRNVATLWGYAFVVSIVELLQQG